MAAKDVIGAERAKRAAIATVVFFMVLILLLMVFIWIPYWAAFAVPTHNLLLMMRMFALPL